STRRNEEIAIEMVRRGELDEPAMLGLEASREDIARRNDRARTPLVLLSCRRRPAMTEQDRRASFPKHRARDGDDFDVDLVRVIELPRREPHGEPLLEHVLLERSSADGGEVLREGLGGLARDDRRTQRGMERDVHEQPDHMITDALLPARTREIEDLIIAKAGRHLERRGETLATGCLAHGSD